MKRTITPNKKSEMKIHCNICNHHTNHQILTSANSIWEDRCDVHFYNTLMNYEILKCLGCDMITIQERWKMIAKGKTENDNHSEKDWMQINYYPNRNISNLSIKPYNSIPKKLNYIYQETVNSINNNQYLLAAAGVRAIIEAICIELNIKKGPIEVDKNGVKRIIQKSNLEGKISGLFNKQIISQTQFDCLTELRYLGNKSIHEIEPPNFYPLKQGIEIMENIIENIYKLSDYHKQLKRNRKT